MIQGRYAHTWVLGVLTAGATPVWLAACSSDADPANPGGPANASADDGTISGVGGMGTSNSGVTATTGGQSSSSSVSTVGAGNSSTGSPATTMGSATTSAGGSSATSGFGGNTGMNTTGDAENTTGDAENTTGSVDGAPTDPDPSTGCGSPLPSPNCSDAPCNLNGLDYFIDVPDDYDSMHPYPVVFQYHPLGGSGQQARTMYRVEPNFPDAIYVSPDGSNNGFPNSGGVDEQMTRDIIADMEANYCIDRARYFATGFSYGGSMSYTAGFCIGDIFRAIAPMAGATISGANSCDPARPVAAWINHGSEDTALPISMSITLRDRLLETNGCSQETMPVDPSPCVAYQGCQEGYPIIWCEQEGVGHAIPNYGAAAIAEFFQQF